MYFTRILKEFRNISLQKSTSILRRVLLYHPLLVKTDLDKIYRLQSSKTVGLRGGAVALLRALVKSLVSFLPKDSGYRYLCTSGMPAVPPASTRGMLILERDAFKTVVDVPTVLVPVEHIGQFQKKVSKQLFKMQGIKPVAELSQDRSDHDKYRLFLFDPDKVKSKEDVSGVFQECLGDYGVDLSTWEIAQIELNFVNWHYDDILRAVLPEDADGVGGFSVIGHILHLNLKDELLPYKDIIGEVLLEKVSKVETVVNKMNTIDNTYRNFQMEVLAGKHEFITTAKSNGNSFKMDFSKVYWNPRLNTEHQRIIDQLNRMDVVYDVFAGIGPFSVPAAKRKCIVLGNDLNPESYKWLKENMENNKVKGEYELHNLDGRKFIQNAVKSDLEKRWKDKDFSDANRSMHVVMNLPALAVEFLDAFCGLMAHLDAEQFPNAPLPMVHCYTFSKADDMIADVKSRVETVLSHPLPENHTIRVVRNVAPRKEMLCVEFKLQPEVLFRKQTQVSGLDTCEDLNEPPTKKHRIEDESSETVKQ